MAPLRLPNKKKNNGGNSRPRPIDFSTLESARASGNPTWTSQDWLEEGVKQEEQGERYIHGAKSTRHYHNAIVAYELAANTSESTDDTVRFDAFYNAARVYYTLGENGTIYSCPKCAIMLERSIDCSMSAFQLFRGGSSLQNHKSLPTLPEQNFPSYEDGLSFAKGWVNSGQIESPQSVIDLLFNLSRALSSLSTLQIESKLGGSRSPLEMTTEALKWLNVVFILQEKSYKSSFMDDDKVKNSQLGGLEEDSMAVDDDIDSSSATDPSGHSNTQATEITIVTANQLVETLVEILEMLITLFENLSSSSSTSSSSDSSTSSHIDLIVQQGYDRIESLLHYGHRIEQDDALHLQVGLLLIQAHATFSPSKSTASSFSSPQFFLQCVSQFYEQIKSFPNHSQVWSEFGDYICENVIFQKGYTLSLASQAFPSSNPTSTSTTEEEMVKVHRFVKNAFDLVPFAYQKAALLIQGGLQFENNDIISSGQPNLSVLNQEAKQILARLYPNLPPTPGDLFNTKARSVLQNAIGGGTGSSGQKPQSHLLPTLLSSNSTSKSYYHLLKCSYEALPTTSQHRFPDIQAISFHDPVRESNGPDADVDGRHDREESRKLALYEARAESMNSLGDLGLLNVSDAGGKGAEGVRCWVKFTPSLRIPGYLSINPQILKGFNSASLLSEILDFDSASRGRGDGTAMGLELPVNLPCWNFVREFRSTFFQFLRCQLRLFPTLADVKLQLALSPPSTPEHQVQFERVTEADMIKLFYVGVTHRSLQFDLMDWIQDEISGDKIWELTGEGTHAVELLFWNEFFEAMGFSLKTISVKERS